MTSGGDPGWRDDPQVGYDAEMRGAGTDAPDDWSRADDRVGRPRLTPLRVTFAVALAGALGMVVYGLFARDSTQLPVLTAGGFVLGLILALMALSAAYAAYRQASTGHSGRAFGYALLGGLAAVLAAAAFTAASILTLVTRG